MCTTSTSTHASTAYANKAALPCRFHIFQSRESVFLELVQPIKTRCNRYIGRARQAYNSTKARLCRRQQAQQLAQSVKTSCDRHVKHAKQTFSTTPLANEATHFSIPLISFQRIKPSVSTTPLDNEALHFPNLVTLSLSSELILPSIQNINKSRCRRLHQPGNTFVYRSFRPVF